MDAHVLLSAALAAALSTPAPGGPQPAAHAAGPFAAACETKLSQPAPSSLDFFGSALAWSAEGLAVGAPGRWPAGAVYVFRHADAGWALTQEIVVPGAPAGTDFGWSVALGGGVLAVGAPRADGPGGKLTGEVCVYEMQASAWQEVAVLSASDPGWQEWFGSAVAVDSAGETIVVGASRDYGGGYESGSIYVFRRAGSGPWTEVLKVPGDSEHDWFGSSVAAEATTVAAGSGQGPSYVLELGPGGLYKQLLQAHGSTVAIQGDTLVADATVFQRGDVWSAVDTLTPASGSPGYAQALAIDGDLIAVGSPWDDEVCGGVSWCNAGAAHVFRETPGGWVEVLKLTASDGQAEDLFGGAVALRGGLLAVGAVGVKLGGNDSGAVYVYDLSCFPGVLED